MQSPPGQVAHSRADTFLSAILGGSIGAILGMRCFRHKTRHRSFVVGMPLILMLQVLLAVGFLIWYRSGIRLLPL